MLERAGLDVQQGKDQRVQRLPTNQSKFLENYLISNLTFVFFQKSNGIANFIKTPMFVHLSPTRH